MAIFDGRRPLWQLPRSADFRESRDEIREAAPGLPLLRQKTGTLPLSTPSINFRIRL